MPKLLSTLSTKSWTFSGLVLAVLLPSLSVGWLPGPLIIGLRKFVILRPVFFGVAEFSPANSRFLVYFCFIFLLQLVYGGFGVRIPCAIVRLTLICGIPKLQKKLNFPFYLKTRLYIFIFFTLSCLKT